MFPYLVKTWRSCRDPLPFRLANLLLFLSRLSGQRTYLGPYLILDEGILSSDRNLRGPLCTPPGSVPSLNDENGMSG